MQILVVGLGRFGRSVARALSGSGHVVIVVDGDEVLVTTRAGSQAVGKRPGATGQ